MKSSPIICGGASELELAKVIAAQMFYFLLIFLPSPSSKIFSLDRGMQLRGLAIIWRYIITHERYIRIYIYIYIYIYRERERERERE